MSALASRRAELALERELVRALHPRRMRVRVSEVIRETVSSVTLRLERLDGELPPFRPGQYLTLYVVVDGARSSRPLSISSAPGLPYLDVTVRAKAGGFVSRYLVERVRPGLELETSGPEGTFRHEPLVDGEDLVLLAGGSGITPFMSLLRDQARRGFPLRITLLYGSRRADDVIFGAELSALARRFERLAYTLFISEPPPGFGGRTGLLDEGVIRAELPVRRGESGVGRRNAEGARSAEGALLGRTFLICGPPEMNALCRDALERLGVPRQRVRVESFGAPTDPSAFPGWPPGLAPDRTFTVELEGHGSVPARAGEPLLAALERAGLDSDSLCRTGACGACRCRVTHGRVFSPDPKLVREADRRVGFVHACAAYPISDLRVRP